MKLTINVNEDRESPKPFSVQINIPGNEKLLSVNSKKNLGHSALFYEGNVQFCWPWPWVLRYSLVNFTEDQRHLKTL